MCVYLQLWFRGTVTLLVNRRLLGDTEIKAIDFSRKIGLFFFIELSVVICRYFEDYVIFFVSLRKKSLVIIKQCLNALIIL